MSTNWTYTFLSLPSSTGYLMFSPSIKLSDIACSLSSEYSESIKTCTATHEGTGSSISQMNEVQTYCSDSCHNAMKAFSICMTNSGFDGNLLLRFWDSGCLRNPSDSSQICLVERLKLLSNKGLDATSLSQNTNGPISCDACTRASMQKMIENYDYLKNKPLYSPNLPKSGATDGAKSNIQNQCGKSYDQLALDSSSTPQSASESLPIYAIVLISVFVALFVAFLGFFIYRNSKKSNELSYQTSYSSLANTHQNSKADSLNKPDYYNYNPRNSNLPPPQMVQNENSGTINGSSNFSHQTFASPSVPSVNSRPSATDYHDSVYDQMRVTSFDK